MELEHYIDFKFSTQDVADILGVHAMTVYRWRTIGYGPRAVKIGNKFRYSEKDIVGWLKEINPKLLPMR